MAVIGEFNKTPELPENLSLLGRIGRGGGGEVFLVRDVTGKQLAYKRINTSWQQNEFESIRALRTLPTHPALTQVFHAGMLPDGDFYYTMELADNAGTDEHYIADTLAYRMLSCQIPLDEICSILLAAVDGAGHLHANGLFHGDLKPENIIFVNGQAKLADFGTVKSPDSAGTPGFLPENPRSGVDCDCYAICKILYCAWSGLDESVYPSLPETFVPSELKLVRRIYLDGCSPNALRRFKNTGSLKAALQYCMEHVNMPLFWTPEKTRLIKIIASIVAVAVALFVAFAAGSRWQNSNSAEGSGAAVLLPAGYPADFTAEIPELPPREKLLKSPEYRDADFTIRTARLNDDYWGLPNVRAAFENVLQKAPDRLDKKKLQEVQAFYQDLDKFNAIRQQLESEKITTEERLKLYNETGFKALYESLNRRLFNPDREFCREILKQNFILQRGSVIDLTGSDPDATRSPDERLQEAGVIIKAAGTLPADYRNLRPMREIFETVFACCRDKLDRQKMRSVQLFYQDMDKFNAIRLSLESDKITPEERLEIYEKSGFRALYESLNRRSFEPDHEFVLDVLQLYNTLEKRRSGQD